MRTLIHFMILLLLVFPAAALLSVPLHALLENVFDIPFRKVLTQSCSITGLVFLFLYLGFRQSLNRQVIGYAPGANTLSRDIAKGFCAGIGIMLVLELALLGLGIHVVEPYLDLSLATLSILFLKAILTGLIVGLLEETLFRGALLGGLQQGTGIITAIVVSSILYAAAHFIKFPALAPDTGINWYTGLALLPEGLSRFGDPAIIDKLLSLFAFGILLALIRYKNGNIFKCIGIHAGVVFTIKFISHLTDYSPDSAYGFLVNTHDHLLGYLAFAWLLSLVIAYRFTLSGNTRIYRT